MNVSGKSLQDIFDAGSKRLEELESNQNESLESATESHLDERIRTEPESLKQLEDRTLELEEEIRSYLSRGLEKVTRTVESEVQETEKYTTRLVESLTLLSKKFSEAVHELKDSSEFTLTDLSTDSHELYRQGLTGVRNKLREQGASAIETCRVEAMSGLNRVTGGAEDAVGTLMSEENASKNKLYESFASVIASVKSTLADSMVALNEALEERSEQMKARSSDAANSIQQQVKEVVDEAAADAQRAEGKLKDNFASLSAQSGKAFDEISAKAVADFVNLHESSMADLSMKSQELSRDMDSLSSTVNEAVRSKNRASEQRGTDLVETYTKELAERLNTTRDFHRDLESERARQLAEIWQELTDVQTRFQEKIQDLSKTTLERLQSIYSEAEQAISAAQTKCKDDSKSNAASKQESIEDAARAFIGRVEEKRRAALDGIQKAGGVSSSTDKKSGDSEEPPAESSSGKRKKSKKQAESTGSIEADDSAPKEDSELSSSADGSQSAETESGSAVVSEQAEEDDSGGDSATDDAEEGSDDDDSHVNPHPADDSSEPSSKKRGKKSKGSSDKRSQGDGKK